MSRGRLFRDLTACDYKAADGELFEHHCDSVNIIISSTDKELCFCRAMLCISAAYAVMRCMSVCLASVTFVYCVETVKDAAMVVNLLSDANMKLYPIFRMVPFSMTLSDHQRLSEIFNNTKHRAAFLQQLSFLFV